MTPASAVDSERAIQEQRLPDLLAVVRNAAPDELPAIIGALEAARAAAWARLVAPPTPAAKADVDQNLSVEAAASRLGVSADWIYKTRLPFKVKIGRRVLCSARQLENWNRQRRERS